MWVLEGPAPSSSEDLSLLDPYEYIVEHVEAVLANRLTMFLGLDEVRQLLDDWAAASTGQSRAVADAVPDSTSLCILTRVLRSLVAEGIPVADLETILETFGAVNPFHPDLEDIIAAVRRALASQISRLVAGRHVVHLSSKLEQDIEGYIREDNGKRFLAMPASWSQRLRARLPAKCRTDPDATVLVVRSARARPYVRRLLAEASPSVFVVAETELIPAPEGVHNIAQGVAVPAGEP